MHQRLQMGEVARKHHIAMRRPDGALYYEECLTRKGFDGPYTILYHQHRPHAYRPGEVIGGWELPFAAPGRLAKRHFQTTELGAGGPPMKARVPLLFNDDLVLSVSRPTTEDPGYFVNADADELTYINRGSGSLRSVLGDLRFEAEDYLYIPKGLLHRFIPDEAREQHWLVMELGDLGVPKQWRNDVGQLRMDAPYSYRDFRVPSFVGPTEEGLRGLVVKRDGSFHGFELQTSPLDVIGWDGTLFPVAFPIRAFQPRVSSIHLPPTWHGTFAARGALVCSFVPRPVDFHPEAIPCPYPHSSVDCDEVLFYCSGDFTSRRGVGEGSVSLHPAGIPHGPHPGAYEASVGTTKTEELAVMVDTFEPLVPTKAAAAIEDADYEQSFLP